MSFDTEIEPRSNSVRARAKSQRNSKMPQISLHSATNCDGMDCRSTFVIEFSDLARKCRTESQKVIFGAHCTRVTGLL